MTDRIWNISTLIVCIFCLFGLGYNLGHILGKIDGAIEQSSGKVNYQYNNKEMKWEDIKNE